VSQSERKTPKERFVDVVMTADADPKPVAEVGIPMRDGIELAADIYFPESSTLPAPAILTMTPYDKRGLFVDQEARFYQDNGYAYIAVDCR
jgi:predicted acyl esterase